MPDSPHTLPSPDSQLGFLLHYLSGMVTRRLEGLLADAGYTHHEYLIMLCMAHEDWVTHYALMRFLGVTKAPVSKSLDRLERAGLVQRGLIRGCRRRKRVSLTAQGQKVIGQLASLAGSNEEYFFLHLQHSQQYALVTALRDLAFRLSR